jgi:hypothetical protein
MLAASFKSLQRLLLPKKTSDRHRLIENRPEGRFFYAILERVNACGLTTKPF